MNKNLRKYSKALYNVSAKNKNILNIKDELNVIMQMYKKVATFRFVIITKSITSEKKCNILKNQEQCDLVIALTHMRIENDLILSKNVLLFVEDINHKELSLKKAQENKQLIIMQQQMIKIKKDF